MSSVVEFIVHEQWIMLSQVKCMEFYSCDCGVSSLPHSLVVQLRSKLPITVQDNLQAAIGAYGRYSCTRDPTHCSRNKYLAQPHINQKKQTDTIFLACLACLLTNKSVNIRIIYRKGRTQHDEMSLWLTYSTYRYPAEKRKKRCLSTT